MLLECKHHKLTGTQPKEILGLELSASIFYLHSKQNILQNICVSSKKDATWKSRCRNKFQGNPQVQRNHFTQNF